MHNYLWDWHKKENIFYKNNNAKSIVELDSGASNPSQESSHY